MSNTDTRSAELRQLWASAVEASDPDSLDDWPLDRIVALEADLAEAVSYLKEAKRKFTPHTTNSFVDSFLEKHSTRKAAEKAKSEAAPAAVSRCEHGNVFCPKCCFP